MAMHLRRAISHRNVTQLFGKRSSAAAVQSRSNLSQYHTLLSPDQIARESDFDNTRFSLGSHSIKDFRRGFAKGRKSSMFIVSQMNDVYANHLESSSLKQFLSSEDDSAGFMEVIPDIGPTVKATASSQMEAAIDALSRELAKLRTGRASPGMLDHIIVETGGVKMPLNHLAVVSVLDSKTLCVNPYDPDSVKELEKAIVSSPLGLNPKLDGQRLIAAIPPSTKEHMQAMCKIVVKSSEDVKQSIRRARQKALDTIKRAGSSLPKDDVKRLEKEVEELTKKFVKSAEDMCKAKEKEITEG